MKKLNITSQAEPNARKFETWTITAYGRNADGQIVKKSVATTVYAVPEGNFRGNPTDHFQIIIDGVSVVSDNLRELRVEASRVFAKLSEQDYQKVLVVRTSGETLDRTHDHSDKFGLQWEIGWLVKGIASPDVVLSETRGWAIHVENYDEPLEHDMVDNIKLGYKEGKRGKREHSVAVIPWTQEREDIIKQIVQSIGEIRNHLNDCLLDADSFAKLVDSTKGKLLLGHSL